MSTGVIIALIVVALVVIAAAAVFAARTGSRGGHGLKRRFGPEYDRAVARHNGDTKAAEHELQERVQRHGSLNRRPLEPAAREQYVARWTRAQERFVESPREAVAEAEALIADLAKDRGFPGGRYDEQVEALSVHHGPHVHGYRRVHRVAGGDAGRADGGHASTEEMREAMVEARALFDELVSDGHSGGRADTRDHVEPTGSGSRTGRGRGHTPGILHRNQAKGS